MKSILLIILTVLVSAISFADNDYRYFVDLTSVNDDKLTIKLIPPTITENDITFMFPAMVPGTYEVYDFGRFVSNFRAEGLNGEVIKIEQLDKNSYKLSPANAIKEISYDVQDTWDTDIKEKFVFEPGGTNIEEGKNFSINTHGFFGYFKNKLNANFILEVTKPKGFYASSSITDIKSGETKDVISIFNYHDLVDAPIMYCQPDTATITIGKAAILISSYSPNKVLTSAFIARQLNTLLQAQANYLGGELPINKYAFLFYFSDKATVSGAMGALEHSYSSFYVMPEADTMAIAQQIRDVAAHEFFHIVTPLNIHAEQIGDFDFNTPAMSKHLWLYEGLTEYAAHHMQAKAGITSYDDFLNTMLDKIKNARSNYNDTVPFTTMSKYVLTKYKKEYNNVYEKGALIGMCLDITLRYYSNGKYGTQDLMNDLSKKYGKTTSFKDDELFNDIEKFTNKETRLFLDTYVAGNKSLPYKAIFDMVGLVYIDKRTENKITLGNVGIGYDEKSARLMVVSTDELDAFGKKIKFKESDILLTFNNRKLTAENAREVLGGFIETAKKGDKLVIEVLRKDKKGNETIKSLKAKVKPVSVLETDILEASEQPIQDALTTRKAWLGIE